MIYLNKGDYKTTLIKVQNTLDHFDYIDNKPTKADVLMTMGYLEYTLENYQRSLKHFNSAIKIYEDYDDEVYLSYAKNNIGLVFAAMGNYNKSRICYE